MARKQVATSSTDPVIGVIVDQLGGYKAQISDLSAIADSCKAALIEKASQSPVRSFGGRLYNATVSFNDRSCTDWGEVMQYLADHGVDQELLLSAHKAATKIAEGVPSVRVSARKEAA